MDIKADRVFDVGGLAKPVKDRVKSWEVKDYQILDLPEYDLMRMENDTGDELTERNYFGERADIVFCLEVMEYILWPNIAVNHLGWLIKQNGFLYISFPQVYPVHNPYQNDYLRYTEFGARKLLGNAGFIIEEIIYRIDRSGLLKEFYQADGMRASKEYGHHEATGFIFKCKKL